MDLQIIAIYFFSESFLFRLLFLSDLAAEGNLLRFAPTPGESPRYVANFAYYLPRSA